MSNIEQHRMIKDLRNASFGDMIHRVFEGASKDGLFAEFGVAGGESLKKMAEIGRDVTWHGFDSFQGLPEKWNCEKEGAFRCSPPTNLPGNCILHIGMFEDVLPKFAEENTQTVSFLNIDCDLYASTKSIFKYLGDRIVPGTYLRFDELYSYGGWEDHEYKALKEFCHEKGRDVEWIFKDGGEKVLLKII